MKGTLEEEVSNLIKSRYGSIKAFAKKNEIPLTTLYTIFNRGLLNSSISNVIRISTALDLSLDGLADGKITDKFLLENSPDEDKLLKDYRLLAPSGKEYIRQTMAIVVQTYPKSEKNNATSNLETAK